MRLLQIAPRIPYPLTDGGSISIYNITRQLSERGAQIYFVASSANDNADSVQKLSGLCQDVLTVKRSKDYGVRTVLRNLFSSVPINVEKYHSKEALDEVIRFVRGKHIDIIHVDHLHMAYYGLALKKILNIPVVLREHNLELKIMQRLSETSSNPAYKAFARFQLKKFLNYEPLICANVDKCVMITEDDRKDLMSLKEDIDAIVIPAGVDTDFFRPNESVGEEDSIAYAGSLDWMPNVDGLKWFVHEVLPIVLSSKPNVRFYIYGKNASREVVKLHDGKNVIFIGFVNDVREVFQKARIMAVPLRIGSGIRIKILEAMAAGKPVVTTSIGFEGIKGEVGKSIMIGDTTEEFAEKILLLLNDKDMCISIGKEASAFVGSEYSWHKIGDLFWETYSSLIKKHRG